MKDDAHNYGRSTTGQLELDLHGEICVIARASEKLTHQGGTCLCLRRVSEYDERIQWEMPLATLTSS